MNYIIMVTKVAYILVSELTQLVRGVLKRGVLVQLGAGEFVWPCTAMNCRGMSAVS